MTPLIQELPLHYQESTPDAALQQALSILADQAQADQDFTLQQLFPSTASGWGLDLWEAAYGIPIDHTQSDQQRRLRILAKIKGVGTTTLERIQALARVYWEKSTVTEEFADYAFTVTMEDTAGNIPYFADFVERVDEMKPAHLAWKPLFRWIVKSHVYVGVYARSAMTHITNIPLPAQGSTPAYIGTYTRTADVAITNITI